MTEREKTTPLTVRLSEEDRRLVECAPGVEGVGVGAFVRSAARERAGEVLRERHEISLGSHGAQRVLAALDDDDDVPSPPLRELFALEAPWRSR